MSNPPELRDCNERLRTPPRLNNQPTAANQSLPAGRARTTSATLKLRGSLNDNRATQAQTVARDHAGPASLRAGAEP